MRAYASSNAAATRMGIIIGFGETRDAGIYLEIRSEWPAAAAMAGGPMVFEVIRRVERVSVRRRIRQ